VRVVEFLILRQLSSILNCVRSFDTFACTPAIDAILALVPIFEFLLNSIELFGSPLCFGEEYDLMITAVIVNYGIQRSVDFFGYGVVHLDFLPSND